MRSPLAFRFGISLLFIAGSSGPVFGAPLFPNPVADAGPIPNSVVIADFDGDGTPDAAVTNRNSNDLAVHLGNGDGTFSESVRYPTVNDPYNLVTADFNRDGKLDLVTIGIKFPYGLAMLLGQGDGTFAPAIVTGGVSGTVWSSGDFSGDGAPEIVLMFNGNLCVMLNNGSGALGAPAGCQPTVSGATSLTIGDFNNDGRPDVAVGGVYAIAVHLGAGGGLLSPRNDVPLATVPQSLATADLNRDGRLDLVSVYVTSYPTPGAPDGIVDVLLGNGAGQFTLYGSFLTESYVTSVTTGDFNGDGKPDVAAGGQGGMDVLMGVGNGTLAPPRYYGAGSRVGSLAAADLDRDGRLDLAVTTIGAALSGRLPSVDGLISFLGSADGTFAQPRYGTGYPSGGIAMGDLDEDGHLDAALNESSRVSILLGEGDGTFTASGTYPTGDASTGIVLGDFDRDGHLDVATARTYGVAFLRGAGDGTFSPAAYFAGGESHSVIIATDTNGDAILDLVVNNQATDVEVFQGNGDGTFWAYRVFSGWSPQGIASADLNGDQIQDLVIGSKPSSSGPGGLAIVRGLGGGSFAAPVHLTWGAVPGEITIADLNGDALPDLIATRYLLAGDYADEVSVFLGLGGATFAPRQVYPAGDGARWAAVGDLDGDGVVDIATANVSSVDVAILRGDGSGGFAPRLRFATLASLLGLAIGDVDEDGDNDIAVAVSTALASVLLNSGTSEPHAPQAQAGPDQVVECASPSGTTVTLDGSASTDADSTPGSNDDIELFRWYENFGTPAQSLIGAGEIVGVALSAGAHAVTLQVTDRSGLQSTDDLMVTIQDTAPPAATVVLAPLLWPPNHRLVPVHANVAAADCNPVTVRLESLTSSEPDDAPGGSDGMTVGDIQGAAVGTADFDFLLRAERSATDAGRTYTATYSVADSLGHSALVQGFAFVPLNLHGVTDPVTIRLYETASGTLVAWDPVGEALHYDVAFGDLATLRAFDPGAGGGPPVCLAHQLVALDTSGYEVVQVPERGSAFFFVVSYVTPAPSGYGTENAPLDLDTVVPADVCP